jgi:hypothetical protein
VPAPPEQQVAIANTNPAQLIVFTPNTDQRGAHTIQFGVPLDFASVALIGLLEGCKKNLNSGVSTAGQAMALSNTVDGGVSSGFKSESPEAGVNVSEGLSPFGVDSGPSRVCPVGGSAGVNGVPISGEGSTGV